MNAMVFILIIWLIIVIVAVTALCYVISGPVGGIVGFICSMVYTSYKLFERN